MLNAKKIVALSSFVFAVGCGAPAVPSPEEGGSGDSGLDATLEAGPEASVESGPEAAQEAAVESGTDTGSRETGGGEGGPGCLPGQLACDGGCVPEDPRNCGTCGHDCTNLAHVSGQVACGAGGTCAFDGGACAAGYAHCVAGSPDDGCETPVDTATNCGMCGATCTGGTPHCAASGSSYSCALGCPANAPTPCGTTCTDTTSDPGNCNACGHVCTTSGAHETAACANSACTFVCNSGYTACAGACADFSTDSANCGSCGNACQGGKTCSGGGCQCGAGTLDCGSSCQAPGPANGCGKGGVCGSACPGPTAGSGSATCNGTNCSISCSSPTTTQCGSACADTSSDPANCGSCGHSCTKGTCSGGLCQGWVVAQAPTTNSVAAVVTDGTSVIWSDTGLGKLLQIPATGGAVITLSSSGVGASLSVGGGIVVYGDGTNLSGAQVGVANSVVNSIGGTGNIPNSTINPAGTIYWFNTFHNGWLIVESPLSGTGGGNAGPFRGALVADGSYAFCADELSGQIQREVPGSFAWSTMGFSGTKLALAGGYLYWLDATGTVNRIPEGSASTGQKAVTGPGVSLYATDGSNVYYPNGTAMESVPVGGGAPTKIATISGCSLITIAGSLLVWVNGSTIYARYVP